MAGSEKDLRAFAGMRGETEVITVEGTVTTFADDDRVEVELRDDSFPGNILNVTVRVIRADGPMKGRPTPFSGEHESVRPGKLDEASVAVGQERPRTVPIQRG